MENDVSGTKLSRKNIKVSLGQLYIYSTRWDKIVVILHIFELKQHPYYFVIRKTLNLSHKKWKSVKLDQYSPIKIYQRLYETTTHYGRNIVIILHSYGARAIFLLFYGNQDIKYESQDI